MSNNNARFQVVDDQWEEREKRHLAFDDFLTRLERLQHAQERMEHQAVQHAKAEMRLREEALRSLPEQEQMIRTFLPDMSDPIIKLIDTALDLLNQLHTIARERPAIQPDMRASLNDLVGALSLPPALLRSAFIGIEWPIDDKIGRLADLSLQRDFDIHKPINNTHVEDDCSDEDKNTPDPA